MPISIIINNIPIRDKTKAVFVLGKNHFRKCFSIFTGVWLRMENAFSRNAFQLSCVGV